MCENDLVFVLPYVFPRIPYCGGSLFFFWTAVKIIRNCFFLSVLTSKFSIFFSLFLCSDGISGTSLGARMLQGGVKKGLLLRNMQVEWTSSCHPDFLIHPGQEQSLAHKTSPLTSYRYLLINQLCMVCHHNYLKGGNTLIRTDPVPVGYRIMHRMHFFFLLSSWMMQFWVLTCSRVCMW